MKIQFFEDHLVIIQTLKGEFYYPPKEIVSAYKLADISEEIFESLTEEQVDQIYYFFYDLETK